MKYLLDYIRFNLLLFSIILSIIIYELVIFLYPEGTIQIIRLTQVYALTALTFLYLTLFIESICNTFRYIPYRAQYSNACLVLGFSAFYFGLLHASIAFFGQLGGFEGLSFLSQRYILAITLSFSALCMLALFAAAPFEFIIKKLPFLKWNYIRHFIHLAGIFILIHAVMLGTHFQVLYEFIPQILFSAIAFLLFLEILRIDTFIKKRFPNIIQTSIVTIPLYALLFIAIIYFLLPIPSTNGVSFGIHAQHIQIAKQAQTGTIPGNTSKVPKIPGLDGDRTKRYTLNFTFTNNVQPNKDVKLSFQVFDAGSGSQTITFRKVYGKVAHLIIVDSSLTYFNHVHPEFENGTFTITTRFPKQGAYRLYLDFQPFGAIEQQIASSLSVGTFDKPIFSDALPDSNLTKIFGQYEVTLQKPQTLQSNLISIGQQTISFTLKDAKTKQSITSLKPYLESFGHLVMINKDTFEYIHVHPADLTVPPPDANGGPSVEFMPIGIYGPIKPGIYRVFAQFNPNGQLIVADYTIRVEK